MIKNIFKKKIVVVILSLLLLYLVLCVPEAGVKTFTTAGKKPFVWDLDRLWTALEKNFREARDLGCEKLNEQIDHSISTLDARLTTIEDSPKSPGDVLFIDLEKEMFHLAPKIAACETRLTDYIALCNRVRKTVKRQSLHWDMNSEPTRSRVYRLLYGTRTALEEVMLQVPVEKIPNLVKVENVPSRTPMASILGVNIHSGDILVSRGGAPTSALIARGNDYPGNFSHIALVYVDEKTHLASIIESHIERGVIIASLEEYIKDKKLRVMVMRLRPGLPELLNDPALPHKAARYALDDARARHIPYDFEMDYKRHDKIFCSEVASAAYGKFGVRLWMGISSISSQGLASWLAAFGVKNFETQEPSDLEYDPQLQVVAEWRDRATLYKDHLDNAVIDVMLEDAEKGDRLTYEWYMLGLARVMKAYSAVVNLLGGVGPIPEGMSASAALKNKGFTKKHAGIKERLLIKAKEFKNKYGYTPPYWELINLARN
ncbi:MAG: hypothetical protein GY950_26745 [bacterium]|nr:hypothetical protein [bacterium]